MIIESLESRRLMSANPIAAAAQAGTVAALAQSAPQAVSNVARPDSTGEHGSPSDHASPIAAMAQAGTVSTLARSEPGAVADAARA